MIIANLTGGLGNQMYQYAFGRYLALKNHTELKLHFTNALFNTQYSYGLGIFKIKAGIATDSELKKMNVVKHRVINRILYLLDERLGIRYNNHIVTQKYPYRFNPKYLTIKNCSYVQGFWQDVRYFNDIKDELQNEFSLLKTLDIKNQKLLNKIKLTNSISIHVRRGDLITNERNHRFIGLDYYIHAIDNIKKKVVNPEFFVFSDDIAWCKINFCKLAHNIVFIDDNKKENAYKDLVLMSNCKHNIIANSTFSWWSSWLNMNKNKLVIRP